MTTSSDDRQEAWKNIGLFLLLTAMLTTLFQLLIYKAGGRGDYLGVGSAWTPGMAALLSCIIIKRDISSLKWKWGDIKWIKIGYMFPIVYCLFIYVPVWVLGLGGNSGPNMDTFNGWSTIVLGEGNVTIFGSLLGLVILMTIGAMKFLLTSLGEEIGWRGFMVWEFRKVMSFQKMAIVTGLIWAAWHWPRYFIGADVIPYEAIILFTLNAAPLGIVLAYLALKSGSIWPAVIMHASVNLYLGTVFGRLNVSPEGGDPTNTLGIFTAVVSLGLGYYFLRRGQKEGL